MMHTITFKKRDIVLVPFPFSDKPGFKKRLAVIFSNEKHFSQYSKYICLANTSQEKKMAQNALNTNYLILSLLAYS